MAGQPGRQLTKRPTMRRTNKLSWQTVGSSCPCQRWCSSWFNLDATGRDGTRRDARCRFSTQFIQSVAVFGALHLLLTAACPRAAPYGSVPRPSAQPLLAVRAMRLHFAATKMKHKFRHFVASRLYTLTATGLGGASRWLQSALRIVFPIPWK